jgi:hypothetical protein
VGPNHVGADYSNAGIGKVMSLLAGRQIDLILFHHSLNTIRGISNFMGNPDEGETPFKLLCKFGGFTTGSVLLPHYPPENYLHLTGDWKDIPSEDHPLIRAYEAFLELQPPFTKSHSARQYPNNWLLLSPSTNGHGPPKVKPKVGQGKAGSSSKSNKKKTSSQPSQTSDAALGETQPITPKNSKHG